MAFKAANFLTTANFANICLYLSNENQTMAWITINGYIQLPNWKELWNVWFSSDNWDTSQSYLFLGSVQQNPLMTLDKKCNGRWTTLKGGISFKGRWFSDLAAMVRKTTLRSSSSPSWSTSSWPAIGAEAKKGYGGWFSNFRLMAGKTPLMWSWCGTWLPASYLQNIFVLHFWCWRNIKLCIVIVRYR